MFLHKFPIPANFQFPNRFTPMKGMAFASPEGEISFSPWSLGGFRIGMAMGKGNRRQYAAAEIAGEGAPLNAEGTIVNGDWRLEVDSSAGLRFSMSYKGQEVLSTPDSPFGISNRRQMLLLNRDPTAPILGLGEKTGLLNKNNRAWHFWNTDACADHPHTFGGDSFDPPYASIPVMIMRTGDVWFGVLFHNPTWCTFQLNLDPADAANCFSACHGMRAEDRRAVAALTADFGRVDIHLIPGPSLADVVRGIAALTGVHDIPPTWALGYHQCRWGYSSVAEIEEVADSLNDVGIPVSCMWMDIDYMHEFRVFTFHPERFEQEDYARMRGKLLERGTRLVTMIDPGIKADPEWSIYQEAVGGGHLCLNPVGSPYVGMVWPGRTVFPDFSQEATRTWWGAKIARHLNAGVDGIWIDMNDPSTGGSDYQEMLFSQGQDEHGAFHNQYANQMAEGTLLGFNPDKRPFILTRSASTGIQRHAAVWTGDNCSNETHLRQSIPMSLNLSISGVSFNGPDVGGFAGDATEELLVTWMLAGALFPFFRNHSSTGTAPQEPHRFPAEALDIMRRCINTRSKLLPYIAHLFRLHHETGDAVMRPVCYEFDDTALVEINDVYMLGSSILVAPFVDLESSERELLLPGGWWFDMRQGLWIEGGRTVVIPRTTRMNFFIRDGAILPVLPGDTFPAAPDFSTVEFHVYTHDITTALLVYREDDGETQAWRKGVFNEYEVKASPDGISIRSLKSALRDAPKTMAAIIYSREAGGDSAIWPFGPCSCHRLEVPVIS